MGNSCIELVHESNRKLINQHNIKVGTMLRNKHTGIIETIGHIHAMYGWLLTTAGDNQKVPQAVEDMLASWEIVDD